MSGPSRAARGEIWMVDLGTGRGREQAGTRPALVVSVDPFNQSGAEPVIAIPLTTRKKNVRTHVEVIPPEGGLTKVSYVKCEDVRSMSRERHMRHLGAVTPATLTLVERILRDLMGL